jgi:hypothetical protein
MKTRIFHEYLLPSFKCVNAYGEICVTANVMAQYIRSFSNSGTILCEGGKQTVRLFLTFGSGSGVVLICKLCIVTTDGGSGMG